MTSHEMKLEISALSETGYVREENQDRMSGSLIPLGHVLIVADGMGGHKGGALAAQLTVEELQTQLAAAPADAPIEDTIRGAFKAANETVYQQAHAGDPTTEGMGSTALVLLVRGEVARLAHVGDSRAYLFRAGRLKQLTRDHTLVQRMVDAGMLTPEEAADHPDASILARAMGTRAEVEVEISGPLVLRDGDALLLCSDGLTGYVPEREIESVLCGSAAVQDIPGALVRLALDRGGRDNVTVQFVQVGRRKARCHPREGKGGGVSGSWLRAAAAFALGVGLGAGGVFLHDRGKPAAPPEATGISQDRSREGSERQGMEQSGREVEEEMKKVRSELEACRERLSAFEQPKPR
jgi:protein phosphatase